MPDAEALEPFVGMWEVEARFPSPDQPVVRGTSTFVWLLGRHFLVQRAQTDHPQAPDSEMVMALDPDAGLPAGYRAHYFDSRGVVRLYEMTFDGREWTLLRTKPDFTPLEFAQRFVGTFSDDGATIEGRWETSPDGSGWQFDFALTYRRVG
jgi:hypothetical protein